MKTFQITWLCRQVLATAAASPSRRRLSGLRRVRTWLENEAMGRCARRRAVNWQGRPTSFLRSIGPPLRPVCAATDPESA
jgi:hypothetical protein